jgi:hypothetical protein
MAYKLEGLPGRFGNYFIRNLVFHVLAEKWDFFIEYKEPEQSRRLGIDLKVGKIDTSKYPPIVVDDGNIVDIINNTNIDLSKYHLTIYNHQTYFQKKEIALMLYNYLHNNDFYKNSIINANIFKERINNNNDVFIHVRLGDVEHINPGYNYYDKLLSDLNFTNGYIASDTIDHEICKKIIEKYNLQVIDKDEVETIMFANTCKYIVLSQGTFSWFIALLTYYAEKIYYPKIKTQWHGNIFVLPELIEVDY